MKQNLRAILIILGIALLMVGGLFLLHHSIGKQGDSNSDTPQIVGLIIILLLVSFFWYQFRKRMPAKGTPRSGTGTSFSMGSIRGSFSAKFFKIGYWILVIACIAVTIWCGMYLYHRYWGDSHSSDDSGTRHAVKLMPYYRPLKVGLNHLEKDDILRFTRVPGMQYYCHTQSGEAVLTQVYETDHRFWYKGIANSYDFHITSGEDHNWAGKYLFTADRTTDIVLEEVRAVN